MNVGTFFYVNASFNVVSDLVVMGLPVPVIAKLQLAKKARIGLAFLFFVGTMLVLLSDPFCHSEVELMLSFQRDSRKHSTVFHLATRRQDPRHKL